jgi:hypothetical protein
MVALNKDACSGWLASHSNSGVPKAFSKPNEGEKALVKLVAADFSPRD